MKTPDLYTRAAVFRATQNIFDIIILTILVSGNIEPSLDKRIIAKRSTDINAIYNTMLWLNHYTMYELRHGRICSVWSWSAFSH